ncbi:MAG: 2Fe-2S iron-sulfur cluster-binding protein [Dehalococcoidia bacterium]
MARLRVEPLGVEVESGPMETVMEAFERAGYYWPVGCNRNGECTNCAMTIVSGLGRVVPMGRFEHENLLRQRGPRGADDPRLRLACQTRVTGDVVVQKDGVALF